MPAPFALYDTDATRHLERAWQARANDAEASLMARAGQAAWRKLLECWPNARRIVVACGPGNNGGDGYVLAHLAKTSGCDVVVFAPESPRTPEAINAARAYAEAGGVVITNFEVFADADVIVDALLGIGLSRAPEGAMREAIIVINTARRPVLSIDAPSGVDADTGAVPGDAVFAAQTLQCLLPHRGLYTGAALDHVGTLSLATLGVVSDDITPAATIYDVACFVRDFPSRLRDAHKGRFGHVFCAGGDHGMGGAIVIACEAALRGGAGRVTAMTHASNMPALLARCPEAISRIVELNEAPSLDFDASVIALGPGLGRGAWGKQLREAVLASRQPCVIDADALHDLPVLHEVASHIFTPHPGEAAALLGCSTPEVQCDRFAAAQALVERTGAAVVLKGAGTIVAAPGETPVLIAAGNAGMSSAGMGDALTGIIAALRAQGLSPFAAACAGAWWHASAGDAALHEGCGPAVLARDVIAKLGDVHAAARSA